MLPRHFQTLCMCTSPCAHLPVRVQHPWLPVVAHQPKLLPPHQCPEATTSPPNPPLAALPKLVHHHAPLILAWPLGSDIRIQGLLTLSFLFRPEALCWLESTPSTHICPALPPTVRYASNLVPASPQPGPLPRLPLVLPHQLLPPRPQSLPRLPPPVLPHQLLPPPPSPAPQAAASCSPLTPASAGAALSGDHQGAALSQAAGGKSRPLPADALPCA